MSDKITNECNCCGNNHEKDTDDGYYELLEEVQNTFDYAWRSSENLFKVQTDHLWYRFLNAIPEEERQHYNCNTCAYFIKSYGGLVTISDTGVIVSALWDPTRVPKLFKPAIKALRECVEKSKVVSVFVPMRNATTLGTFRSNGFSHFSVTLPEAHVYKNRLVSSMQMHSNYIERRSMIIKVLREYRINDIKKAISILESGNLAKGKDFAANARWLLKLATIFSSNNKYKDNLIWKEVASAPTGFFHIRSGMIGYLMELINDTSNDMDDIIRKFNDKMDPLIYLRPQAAPTSGNVKRAEEIFSRLDLAESLARRYASVEEIEYIWTPTDSGYGMNGQKNKDGSIFGNVRTKDSIAEDNNLNRLIPNRRMSMNCFLKNILPNAESMNLAESNRSLYTISFFTTACNPDANPILKWDKPERRNPVSIYVYKDGTSLRSANLTTDSKVIGVCYNPEMWYGNKVPSSEHSVTFIMEDGRDVHALNGADIGLAIFPQILIPELHEVRATIEAYSATGRLGKSIDDSYATGITFVKGMLDYNLKFKVRSKDLHEDTYITITSWEEY